MNILYISPNSPFESIGGIERYLTNLISYSEGREGTKTFILMPSFSENKTEVRGNVAILSHQSMGLTRDDLAQTGRVTEKAKQFAQYLREVVQENKIDVISAENFHLGLPPAYSLQLAMVADFYNIPTVLRLHSFASSEIQTELINQLMWKKISCVSRSVAGDCFQKGTDIDLLSTDYLGVDTSKFKPSTEASERIKEKLSLAQDSKVILTATRIVQGNRSILKEKGLITTIRAFSKLLGRHPELRLLIAVGRPPKNLDRQFNDALEMLQGYLKLHNVEEQTVVQAFDLEEMPEVYAGSDVFVLPSENETFGQVFIEAMASGIPVVGTNVGGIPEIISDSNNGYLVAPNNSTTLSQRIKKVLYDEEVRDNFIRAGLETVAKKFDAERRFELFDKKLKKIVHE